MMVNYKLTIQYDGSRYRGWQRLGADEETIQGRLEEALSKADKRPVEIHGCSRTDGGVHALAQVANVRLRWDRTSEELREILNESLPEDIVIQRVEKAGEDFHARYDAKAKTYLYRIWNRDYPNPFLRKYSMHIEKELDMDKMAEAARYFRGTHDFTAYSNAKGYQDLKDRMTVKAQKKSMYRQIYSIRIEREEGMILIRVRGEGFLYNMVRKIVGSLIEVGLGRMEPEEIPEIIRGKDRSRTGGLAEAGGLLLEKIEY